MIKNRLNDNKKSLLSSLFERSDFFISVPTFVFPCPRKNFCVGREKNIPGQGSDFTIVIKWDF